MPKPFIHAPARRGDTSWFGTIFVLLLASLVLALSACSGGGAGVDTGGAPPPPAAAAAAITVQPADRSSVEGSAVSFSVVATDALGYQWQSLAPAANAVWSDVAGATGASYTTPASTQALHDTRYRVLVRSAVGEAAVSSVVRLSVTAALVPAAIVVQPAPQTVLVGATATFSVTATGSALSYAWQASDDGLTGWADLPATSLPTFTLPATAAADNGRHFRVLVGNSLGGVTSASALLTVQPVGAAPTFAQMPQSQSVIVGASATFSVQVLGTPTPTLQWRSGSDGVNWTDIVGATAASWTVSSVALSQNDLRLQVVARNSSGSLSSQSALLTVSASGQAPGFGLQPQDGSVSVGSSIRLSVIATGTPTPTLQWQTAAPGSSTFSNINGATGSTLSTPALTAADDNRRYQALASNASGTASSRVATVRVGAAAGLLQVALTPAPNEFGNREVLAGEAVTLTAVASGTLGGGVPTFTWTAAGRQVATGNSYTTAPVALNSPITVTVTARDGLGTATARITLLGQPARAPTASDGGDIVVVTGSPVTMRAPSEFLYSRGLPTATVQWQRSTDAGVTWTDLSGQVGETLELASTTLSDNGNRFRFVLTNPSGSAAGDYRLQVGPARGPMLHVLGGTLLARVGEPTWSRSTPASGIPTPTIEVHSSRDDGATWQLLDAAAQAQPLVAADQGRLFRVMARNASGTSTSHPMRLRLLHDTRSEADWYSWPTGLRVPEGSIASFSAEPRNVRGLAGNVGSVRMNWQQSGDNGATWQAVTEAVQGAGELTETITSGSTTLLETLPTTLADHGKLFRLRVALGGSEWFSGTARLDVLPRPAANRPQLNLWAGGTGGAGTLDGPLARARFRSLVGLGRDGQGNLYSVEQAFDAPMALRQIAPAGEVRTLHMVGPVRITGIVSGMAVATDGTVYVAEGQRIYKRGLDGIVVRWAGGGSGDGAGAAAGFEGIVALAVASDGGLLVVEGPSGPNEADDSRPHCIRRVSIGAAVSTLAGVCGVAGRGVRGMVDGVGSAARFLRPTSIVLGGDGAAYVVDAGNRRIRRVAMDGSVSTVTGQGSTGVGLPRNDLNRVDTLASADFYRPRTLGVDSAGRLLVSDEVEWGQFLSQTSTVLRLVDPANNQVTRLTGGLQRAALDVFANADDGPASIATLSAGSSPVSDGQGGWRFVDYGFDDGSVFPDEGNGVYSRSLSASLIRRVAADGSIGTLTGQRPASGSNDGLGAAARFKRPMGLATDGQGSLVLADTANHTIRRIDRFGNSSTLAGAAQVAGGHADGVGPAARFNTPMGVALAADGSVFVADARNHVIRRIATNGAVTTVAGAVGQSGFVDGSGTVARFSSPRSLAFLTDGSLAVADRGGLRILQADGLVSTRGSPPIGNAVIGSIWAPFGVQAVAAGANGDTYISVHKHGILRVTAAGAVSAVAGGIDAGWRAHGDGLAYDAEFAWITGMALDQAGRLWVADAGSTSLRRVDADGSVSTVAGFTAHSLESFGRPNSVFGSMGRGGVVLGDEPSLGFVGGLALLPSGRIALTSEHAVLVLTVP